MSRRGGIGIMAYKEDMIQATNKMNKNLERLKTRCIQHLKLTHPLKSSTFMLFIITFIVTYLIYMTSVQLLPNPNNDTDEEYITMNDFLKTRAMDDKDEMNVALNNINIIPYIFIVLFLFIVIIRIKNQKLVLSDSWLKAKGFLTFIVFIIFMWYFFNVILISNLIVSPEEKDDNNQEKK